MSLLLAQMRSAECVEQCPSSGANRKTYARTEFFSVWTQSGTGADHQSGNEVADLRENLRTSRRAPPSCWAGRV